MTAHGGRFLQCNGASGSVRIGGEERDSQTTEITPSKVNRGANRMRLHEACRMDTGTHAHTHTYSTRTLQPPPMSWQHPEYLHEESGVTFPRQLPNVPAFTEITRND